ncbi:MAG: hypothetical protein KA004_07480 [Verrucomicrobiales bacterium]|nr:hypothetical protein [Verrucomicrobiales bacterium]
MKALMIAAGLAVFAGMTGQSAHAEDPVIRSVSLRPFHIELMHSGDAGALHGLEFSTDCNTWSLLGPTTEISPGRFRFADPSVIRQDRGFHRIQSGLDPALFGWQNAYPVTYIDGMSPDHDPVFIWAPLPGGALSYRFELFAALPDGDGGYAPSGLPLVSKAGLLVPGCEFSGGDALLMPGGMFAWRVVAVTPARLVPGRFVIIPGMEADAIAEDPLLPAALRGGRGAGDCEGAAPNWPQVLEMVKKIAEKKEEVRKALNENSLVEEKKLLEQLLLMLRDHEALKEALTSLLNGDSTKLSDPDTLLKALCYLDSMLEFVQNFDKNMTEKRRKALKKFAEKVKKHKEDLEKAQDRQALVDAILQDLSNFLSPSGEDGSAVIEYLKEAITDKLKEKLEEVLAKKLGAKAAGALVSIISDLVNMADLLLKLNELEDLCREYNRLLLKAIACDDGSRSGRGRKYHGSVDEKKLNCNVTLSYHKRCFVRDANGGPNDGHWEDSPVRFSDGTSSVTKRYSQISNGPGSRMGTSAYELHMELHADDMGCPPGRGPCLLYLLIEERCPHDPSLDRDIALFAGVIKC